MKTFTQLCQKIKARSLIFEDYRQARANWSSQASDQEIVDAINRFKQIQNGLAPTQRAIEAWQNGPFQTFKAFIDSYQSRRAAKAERGQRGNQVGFAQFVDAPEIEAIGYDLIFIPDYQSCQFYQREFRGKSASWCIGTSNPEFFFQRYRESMFFFLIKKREVFDLDDKFSKVAVQVRSIQYPEVTYWDMLDNDDTFLDKEDEDEEEYENAYYLSQDELEEHGKIDQFISDGLDFHKFERLSKTFRPRFSHLAQLCDWWRDLKEREQEIIRKQICYTIGPGINGINRRDSQIWMEMLEKSEQSNNHPYLSLFLDPSQISILRQISTAFGNGLKSASTQPYHGEFPIDSMLALGILASSAQDEKKAVAQAYADSYFKVEMKSFTNHALRCMSKNCTSQTREKIQELASIIHLPLTEKLINERGLELFTKFPCLLKKLVTAAVAERLEYRMIKQAMRVLLSDQFDIKLLDSYVKDFNPENGGTVFSKTIEDISSAQIFGQESALMDSGKRRASLILRKLPPKYALAYPDLAQREQLAKIPMWQFEQLLKLRPEYWSIRPIKSKKDIPRTRASIEAVLKKCPEAMREYQKYLPYREIAQLVAANPHILNYIDDQSIDPTQLIYDAPRSLLTKNKSSKTNHQIKCMQTQWFILQKHAREFDPKLSFLSKIDFNLYVQTFEKESKSEYTHYLDELDQELCTFSKGLLIPEKWKQVFLKCSRMKLFSILNDPKASKIYPIRALPESTKAFYAIARSIRLNPSSLKDQSFGENLLIAIISDFSREKPIFTNLESKLDWSTYGALELLELLEAAGADIASARRLCSLMEERGFNAVYKSAEQTPLSDRTKSLWSILPPEDRDQLLENLNLQKVVAEVREKLLPLVKSCIEKPLHKTLVLSSSGCATRCNAGFEAALFAFLQPRSMYEKIKTQIEDKISNWPIDDDIQSIVKGYEELGLINLEKSSDLPQEDLALESKEDLVRAYIKVLRS